PTLPDAWVALVEHLARTGQKAASHAELAEAEQALPPERRCWTLGRCHEALGEPVLAEEWFRKDVQSRPGAFLSWRPLAEFYLRQEQYEAAEKWLRKLIHPANQVPGELVALAQRQLAVALARQGGETNYQEALRLVDAAAGSTGTAWEDTVARALV